MRPALALLGLGWAALVLEGSVARLLPAFAIPDLSLLVTIAAASVLEPGLGLVVATAIGLGADMVAGPLFGQFAFLRLLEFTFARAVSAQLDLRRGVPLIVFVFGLVIVDAGAQVALARLFLGGFPLEPSALGGVVATALVTASLAPWAAGLARRLREQLDETEARRDMRLDTRRSVLR